MAALDFPTATAAGQTFEADTGVIYVYVGTPPNGFWSANAGVSGQAALDARYVQVAGDTMTGNLINNARILIGTTDEGSAQADELTVANSTDAGITIRSGDSNQGSLYFSDVTTGAGEYSGWLLYDHQNNNVTIGTDSNERLRIDSNGRLLLGTVTEGNAYADDLTIASSGDTGLTIRSGAANQGNILFSDGTSGADEYRGQIMYNHVSNVFGFITDAIERMTIDSNGRLLLGTTTEGYATYADKLTIANAGHCGMTIRSGSSHNGSIYFSDATSGTSEYDGYIEYQHTDRRFLFGTAAQSHMVIDSSGNVGVGESSPSTLLHLKGSADTYLTLQAGTTSGNDGILFKNSAGTQKGVILFDTDNDYMFFSTDNTERMRINSAGRLLVGTTETSVHPDRLIEIGNTTRSGTYQAITTSSSGVGGIVFADTVTNDTGGYRGLIQYFHADDAMVLKTSSVEAMRITSDGKVGIGELNPAAPLHVKSTAVSQLIVERDGSGTQIASIILKDGSGDQNRISSTDSNLVFGSGASNSEKMRLDSSGRLNIGTTSGNAGRPVHIHTASSGSSYFHSTNDGTGATAADGVVLGMGDATNAYMWNYESGAIQFATNNAAAMTIEGSGFVKAQKGYLYVQKDSGTGNADGVALIVDGNADAYLWNYENTTLRFGTNNTEAMRVDNGGNVGIGVTSPQQPLHLKGAYFRIDDASQSLGTMYLGAENGQNSIYSQGANGAATAQPLRFMLGGGTETMRIDSNSDVHIGKTAFTSHNTNGTTLANGGWAHHCAANIAALYLNRNNSNGNIAEFYVSNSYIGNINYNGTTCTFNNVSDYRLKENVVDIADGIARVKQLSPRRFNFISNPDATVDGFIAHEAQAVVPQAVCGEKDGEQMQGIDQSQLVPLLTAALQEAIAKIETLETRVAALEAG